MAAQAPALQSWPEGQTRPQPPQLAGSVLVFTHTELHSVAPPPAQSTAHTPPAQSWPPGHSLPQVPQFFGSSLVSAQ